MTAKAISALTPEVTGGVWASIEGCRWLALSKGHFFRLRDFYAAAQLFFDVLESFVTALPRKSLLDEKNVPSKAPANDNLLRLPTLLLRF